MLLPITRPTAVLNSAIARQNIARMAARARQSRVLLRPHFKTHQSAGVGEWFRAEGVTAITVSSVEMATYFAAHGWTDILIAFPVNWLEIAAINQLAAQVHLGLLVESVETANFLSGHLIKSVDVWLKVDTGYHRTGIAWHDIDLLKAVSAAVREGTNQRLCGLLTHAGHSYHAHSQAEIEVIYTETVAHLNAAQQTLAYAGIGDLALSLGDTPCCSVVEDLSAVDEIRPGNFVFYDLTQVEIGACTPADIAVAVACPVVAVHPVAGKVIIYGGGVHLSKEELPFADGRVTYGAVCLPEPGGWSAPLPDCTVTGLSQEHGTIQASAALLDRVKVGDMLYILPVHSCMSVNLLKHYLTLEGEEISMMGWPGSVT